MSFLRVSGLGASSVRRLRSFPCFPLAALALIACNGRLEITDDDIGAGGTSPLAGAGGSSGSAGLPSSGGSGAAPASCDDGVQNGSEADVDCGGATCAACPSERCTNPIQCEHNVCLDGVCQPPRCDDGVLNGDEAGVDCGGTSSCGPCSTLCTEQCAVSDTLIPLGCDPRGPAPIGAASRPRSNDDGTLVAFDYCYEDSRCTPMYWSRAVGVRALPVTGGGTLAGMSSDGQIVLVSPQLTFGGQSLLFAPDGTSVPSGLGPTPGLVSANGTLVGVSPTTNGSFALLRRPRGGAAEALGELPFGSAEFTLSGATPDASVIVGYSHEGSYQPFRYTEGGGLVFGLEGLPGAADGASINALSRDGRVFAGITFGNERQNVFRWTEADGVVELAPVAPNTPGIDPTSMALSDDGGVLVFSRETNAATRDFGAYRWTTQTGSEPLTPGIQSAASLVSGDGSVIVGQSFDVQDYRAFVWTPTRGPRSIRAALETSGVDFTGWSFDVPWSLSRDGKIAMGIGRCGDIPTVYRLVLPE